MRGTDFIAVVLALSCAAVWASGPRPELVLGYPEREKNPFIADAPSNDGIFQDVLRVATERIGAELRIERLPKKRIFQYMREGRVDLYPGSPTPDRNDVMSWISFGFPAKNVCLVRSDIKPFRHLRDAPALRLIYEVGDSRANFPDQYPQLKGIAAAAQLSTEDAVRMLRNNYGDLFVTQRETYLFYLRTQQLDSLDRFKIRYEEDCTGPGREYVLGVAKKSRHYAGLPNPDYRPGKPISLYNQPSRIDPASLAGRLRDTLLEMQESGEAQRLVDRRIAR